MSVGFAVSIRLEVIVLCIEEDKRTSVIVNNSLYLAGSRMAEYQFNADEDPENARKERESGNVFEPKECIGTPKRMMGTVLARQ
jgi:hypothetical protein